MGQVAGVGEDLVVLGGPHFQHAAADARPELPGAAEPIGRGPRCGRQDAGPALEQVGASVVHAPALGPGDRVGADEDRGAAGKALDGLNDLPLRAARIGDQHAWRGRLGAIPDVLGHSVDRRADDHDIGRSRPVAEVGRGPVDRAALDRRASVAASRPTPTTSVASRRVRSASPIDPPINPTPTIATLDTGSKCSAPCSTFRQFDP